MSWRRQGNAPASVCAFPCPKGPLPGPPRRHTAHPSAKNTLRRWRNCFFVCGARCAPAPGPSALRVTLRLAHGRAAKSRCAKNAAGLGPACFFVSALLSDPVRGLRASWCHAAGPPRRHTARPSAKNTLRRWRNCFFVCGARCAPAPGPSALLGVTLRALRDGTLLAPPRKTPCAVGATAFSSAGLAVRLLPGPPRFLLVQQAGDAGRRRRELQIPRSPAGRRARSFRCASFPHRTRSAGLRRGPRRSCPAL